MQVSEKDGSSIAYNGTSGKNVPLLPLREKVA